MHFHGYLARGDEKITFTSDWLWMPPGQIPPDRRATWPEKPNENLDEAAAAATLEAAAREAVEWAVEKFTPIHANVYRGQENGPSIEAYAERGLFNLLQGADICWPGGVYVVCCAHSGSNARCPDRRPDTARPPGACRATGIP